MVDSIHVARWIAQFDPTEVKFILFPSGPNRRVHPKILEMIAKGKKFDNQIKIVPFGGKLSLPLWALDRFFNDRIRGLLLRRILKMTLPDFVHALELQHAGYVTMRALADKSISTPFIATNYGSDIYWFQQFPTHLRRIREMLQRADAYSAECQRDIVLAHKLGFDKKVMPLIPNAGGISQQTSIRLFHTTSTRLTIALKGYDSWAGLAKLARRALSRISPALVRGGYSVEVYSAGIRSSLWRAYMQIFHGVRVVTHRRGKLQHAQMLDLFSRSRIYIGVSRTDGLSTSMIEAMSQGAFPIQSSTACLDNVLDDGLTGFALQSFSIEEIASKISRALKDDELVDRAALLNREFCRTTFSNERIRALARTFYSQKIT